MPADSIKAFFLGARSIYCLIAIKNRDFLPCMGRFQGFGGLILAVINVISAIRTALTGQQL
jgi:hypothetical protein